MNVKSFNVCPFDVRLCRRLPSQPKPRRPFSERAAELAQEAQRYREEAVKFAGGERFRLGRTDFELKDNSTRLLADNKAALFAYAACLGVERVSLRMGDLLPSLTSVSLYATESFSGQPGSKDLQLMLEFSVSSFATLNFIKSHRQGLGGKALALFYNFVREMGAEKIVYFLGTDNVQALGFYVHTDFGGPVDPDAHRWELDIVSGF